MASTAASIAPPRDDDVLPQAELAAWHAQVRLRAIARLYAPPPPTLRPLRILALVIVLVLHALLLFGLRVAMHKPPLGSVQPVQVRLIVETAEPPLPQPAALPPRVPANLLAVPRAPRVLSRPRDAAPPAEIPTPEAVPHVFNPDGSIALPPATAPRSDALTANFEAPPPSPDQKIMRHQRPLKVRPNHFAQYFRADSGSALTDFVSDHLTFEQEFVLPWGTHVKCAEVFVLVALGGGCGWETPYPYYVPVERWKPATSLDEQ